MAYKKIILIGLSFLILIGTIIAGNYGLVRILSESDIPWFFESLAITSIESLILAIFYYYLFLPSNPPSDESKEITSGCIACIYGGSNDPSLDYDEVPIIDSSTSSREAIDRILLMVCLWYFLADAAITISYAILANQIIRHNYYDVSIGLSCIMYMLIFVIFAHRKVKL